MPSSPPCSMKSKPTTRKSLRLARTKVIVIDDESDGEPMSRKANPCDPVEGTKPLITRKRGRSSGGVSNSKPMHKRRRTNIPEVSVDALDRVKIQIEAVGDENSYPSDAKPPKRASSVSKKPLQDVTNASGQRRVGGVAKPKFLKAVRKLASNKSIPGHMSIGPSGTLERSNGDSLKASAASEESVAQQQDRVTISEESNASGGGKVVMARSSHTSAVSAGTIGKRISCASMCASIDKPGPSDDSAASSELEWPAGPSCESAPVTPENHIATRQTCETTPDDVVEPRYLSTVFQFGLQTEATYMPSPMYLESQDDLSPAMRRKLVTWMGEVQIQFKLSKHTMYMAVNLFDRFIGHQTKNLKQVLRGKIQLVATVCLMLASKYEEMDQHQPKLEDFEWVTNRSCSVEDLVRMEQKICIDLEWQFTWKSSPLAFLGHLQSVTGTTERHVEVATFLCDLALLDYSALTIRPSVLAVTAFDFAARLLSEQPRAGLRKLANVSAQEEACCHELLSKLWAASSPDDAFAARPWYL